ncbi:MAG: molybdate ABC transporter substrate-binding protein [Pseudomonadota bacterium]
MRTFKTSLLFLCLLLAATLQARAETVLVAVSSNFLSTAERLAAGFRASGSDVSVRFAPGSTGKLYAQIKTGAPFDIFLSADRERPLLLEREGLAVQRKAYALGKLVFARRAGFGGPPLPETVTDVGTVIARPSGAISLANPQVAPYGRAARQVLKGSRRAGELLAAAIPGNSVGQAFTNIVTGNASVGLVALSQVLDYQLSQSQTELEFALVDPALHDLIVQDAVMLAKGNQSATALAFFAYIQSDEGRSIIQASGYDLPPR